jgi:hypothetical protein
MMDNSLFTVNSNCYLFIMIWTLHMMMLLCGPKLVKYLFYSMLGAQGFEQGGVFIVPHLL